MRRSALVSRYGCLGVSNGIWDKTPSALGVGLGADPAAPLPDRADAAALTRARRDSRRSPSSSVNGSMAAGIPEAVTAAAIPRPARLLAAADVYQAMLEPRPHRPARRPDEAADELRSEARAGRLDSEAVEAVLGVAGHLPARRIDGPGRPHPPRDRGPAAHRTRLFEQGCGRPSRDLAEDGGHAHRAHLRQARRVQPRRSRPLRRAARTAARAGD